MDRTRAELEARARAAENAVSRNGEGRSALEATIQSAELYMQALKLADSPTERRRLDRKCKELLNQAEQFKSAQNGSSRASGAVAPSGLQYPSSSRKLTTRENIILLEGSKLNGFVFKPWNQPPSPEEFVLRDGAPMFSDSSLLSLSETQLEIFGGWKRPVEALSMIETPSSKPSRSKKPCMHILGNIDLVQDLTSDCSVVASLCAGTSRAERGHSKLMGSIMYPNDPQKGTASISPNGKYVLHLYFNGCWRRVEIDDFLPTSTTSRVLHVIDRTHPSLLWPALMEKAYLKIRGGYDFPGSNSGTDLAVFTGWIPQQVFLHDEGVEADHLWEEVYESFHKGDNLLTIGTGKLSKKEQKYLGLGAEHDYAILDMKITGSIREMLIKNPWADGDVWKGATRRKPNPNHESPTHAQPEDKCKGMLPGTFWMDFNSVFQYFENMYLNWNPAIFSYREDILFSWQLPEVSSAPTIMDNNPQYCIRASKTGEVWLLLNRHFRTGDYTQANNGKNGYISLYLYESNGRRVLSSEGARIRGPFVDSPNTLLRVQATAHTTYTVVVVSQDLPAGKHNFTFSTFSDSPVTLAEAESLFLSKQSVSAAWTRSSAGGNSDSSNYLSNPQFKVNIRSDQEVAFVLKIDNESINTKSKTKTDVHVKALVLVSDGSRTTRFRGRDVIANSGDYRRDSAVVETFLSKGTYNIICSTFEENQFARFTLDFCSSADQSTSLVLIPSESSGRLSVVSTPAVFEPGVEKMLAPITLQRVARVITLAKQKNQTATSSLLKMSLEQSQGPYKTVIADSTFDEYEYSPISAGLRINDLTLHPSMHASGSGGLWLVLERLTSGSNHSTQQEVVHVEMLSEEAVIIGQWGIGSG